ncbi:MAG TPA: hypothetical protein VLK82_01970, partial [Candidatus Tectomicrobia bacterium]|nr:hypothetical protein [Candidatus Tectomicrobia bacterium]
MPTQYSIGGPRLLTGDAEAEPVEPNTLQTLHTALPQQWTGLPGLPEVLMDERRHLLERLLGGRRREIAQQP